MSWFRFVWTRDATWFNFKFAVSQTWTQILWKLGLVEGYEVNMGSGYCQLSCDRPAVGPWKWVETDDGWDIVRMTDEEIREANNADRS